MYYHKAHRRPQDIARDPKVVNAVIKKLEAKLGQESPLVTSQGKTIDYLGMCLFTIHPKEKLKYPCTNISTRC